MTACARHTTVPPRILTHERAISPGLGLALLRGALGLMYLAHAGLKLFVFTLPGTAQWLSGDGAFALRRGEWMTWRAR